MFGFFEGKTFVPDKDIPDLSGKVILVTGGNTGLGKESVLQLSKHNPKTIYLAARTQSKAEAAIQEIKSAVPTAQVEFLHLDLTDLASVKSAADDFLSRSPRLDILLNNAGVMALPFSTTQQGYEIQFGTNHIGHALLTKLLLPTLLKTAEQAPQQQNDIRIVNVSSLGHRLAPYSSGIITDAAAAESYNTWARYGVSKLANILHARALAKRYPQITATACHPGVILTDLYAAQQEGRWFRYAMNAVGRFVMGGVREGALSQLWCCTAPRGEVREGYFWMPVGVNSKGSGWAQDEKLAEELWEWTEAELKKQGY